MKLLSALHIRMMEYKFSGVTEVPAKRLGEFEEVIGILQEISEKEGRMTLSFNNGIKIILSPDLQLKKSLRKRKGKRISLLRTDIEDKPYLMREVEAIK